MVEQSEMVEFKLSKELLEKLRMASRQRGLSVSAYIRMVLLKEVDRNEGG